MIPTYEKAVELVRVCEEAGLMIATAESCTGGMIAASITDVAGSSAVLDRGFVTYSNEAKQEMLEVSAATLEAFGAVSQQTAGEMAEGALDRSNAQLAISVTGIAGPGGGSADKPVGLVYMALARHGAATRHKVLKCGEIGRDAVRLATVEEALDMLFEAASGS